MDLHSIDTACWPPRTALSRAKPEQAVCDAGLKVQSLDSGLPVIHAATM